MGTAPLLDALRQQLSNRWLAPAGVGAAALIVAARGGSASSSGTTSSQDRG
jgi:hypothetical protein